MIERAIRTLEAPFVVRESFRPLDAIVVLGAPLGPGDRLTPPLAERARAAAALFHAGGAPIIIATGGVTRGASRAEADVIADEIRRHGVADDKIVVERASKTTLENARYTAALFEQVSSCEEREDRAPRRLQRDAFPGGHDGRTRIWLVTQPFHGRRARRLFQRAGFDAHVWRIDNSLEYRDRRRALRWVVREYAAWAVMLARGH